MCTSFMRISSQLTANGSWCSCSAISNKLSVWNTNNSTLCQKEWFPSKKSSFPTKLSYHYYWSNKHWMMHQKFISSQTVLQAEFRKRSSSDLDFLSLGFCSWIKPGPWRWFTPLKGTSQTSPPTLLWFTLPAVLGHMKWILLQQNQTWKSLQSPA